MTTKHEYPLMDLDDLCFRMKCATRTVAAIHVAVESGPSTAESFLDALYGSYHFLDTLTDELREITDLLFEEVRAAKEEGTTDA